MGNSSAIAVSLLDDSPQVNPYLSNLLSPPPLGGPCCRRDAIEPPLASRPCRHSHWAFRAPRRLIIRSPGSSHSRSRVEPARSLPHRAADKHTSSSKGRRPLRGFVVFANGRRPSRVQASILTLSRSSASGRYGSVRRLDTAPSRRAGAGECLHLLPPPSPPGARGAGAPASSRSKGKPRFSTISNLFERSSPSPART